MSDMKDIGAGCGNIISKSRQRSRMIIKFYNQLEIAPQHVDLKEGADTRDLLRKVVEEFPGLEQVLTTAVLSINLEYVDSKSNTKLNEGDEVAIIPPISGG